MKNKILKILSLIAICTMMIASLCSFTTTQTMPTQYAIYESYTQCDLSYRYHKTNSGYYFGTIPSANRILLDPTQTTIAGIRDSVKFEAADMYMGNSTKSIDIRSFTVSSLPSKLTRDTTTGDLNLGICYRSDDYLYSQLDSTFTFWNYNFKDLIYIEPYDVTYQPYSASETENFSGWVTVGLLFYDYDSNSFRTEEFNFVGTLEDMYRLNSPTPSSSLIFDLNSIVLTVLDTYDIVVDSYGTDYWITKVELSLDYVPADGSAFLGYGAIRLFSNIYEKETDGLNVSDLYGALDKIYDIKTNVSNELAIIKNELLQTKNALTAANKTIQDLKDGDENVKAIPLLFDGIYKTIYNTLTIFFNMDFFGTPLGNIVSILLGAAIVIVILKVVL